MTQNTEDLRAAITRSRANAVRWRCPAPLKEEIVALTERRRAEGTPLMTIARELGVSESGLNRWLQKKSGSIRPIRVIEQAAAAAELVLVTPGGYRLEGLDAASAVDLLRRLGC